MLWRLVDRQQAVQTEAKSTLKHMPPKISTPKKKKEDKAGIIEAVKTPLGLCALIVLVIEGILAAISIRLSGWDLT
ncbi:MAG: hypothetical protein WCE61_22180, partial [Candidatus Acidiferrum sp.]